MDCVEIPKRVWHSNKNNEYILQDDKNDEYMPQDDEIYKYRSKINLDEETVPTGSNYYSESLISKHEKYSNKKKRRVAVPLPVSYSQLRKQPIDPFHNCGLKAASGTKNGFDLMYTYGKKNAKISEYDETDSSYLVNINNKQVLSKHQKVNMQDESVGQLSETSKSLKVSKSGETLLRSPRHLNIEYKYSRKTKQQLNKKQTTITKAFETFLSKPHNISEQAIRDRAIIEVVIFQNLSFSFIEDKMFERFAKIVDLR
ncbi:3464_t:CDS:2 [Dentiscutata erythropus]|uniref:3464_t:CDS:1 n=1 Tax=Dentiscutata erythropus TaxID=1348616 RepID=A0A9N9EK89_9GLOM|nr:3464_t:CDS:2 [Dentiscutata erythropus]